MRSSRTLRWALRSAVGFLIVFSCVWLSVYLGSILQRRKAERLISDLRAFPFSTAGFAEVRDFTNGHGGASIQVLSQVPPLTCTVQNCAFQIGIVHPLLRLPPSRPTELVYNALPYLGIRPWGVFAILEVTGGRLSTTTTKIEQLKIGRSGNYEGLLEKVYGVSTGPTCSDPGLCDENSDYQVGRPDGYGGAAISSLFAWVRGNSDAPKRRAFDINLRCLTSVLRGCDFRELAPSSWAEYESRSPGVREDR